MVAATIDDVSTATSSTPRPGLTSFWHDLPREGRLLLSTVIVDAPGSYIDGIVGEEILVVPDLRPDRLEAMLASKLVITENGGELAHLANVSREMPAPIPILRVPGAMARFPVGTRLAVTPSEGRIRWKSRPKKDA